MSSGRKVPPKAPPLILLAIIIAVMAVAAVVIFVLPEEGSGNYRVLHHFAGFEGADPGGTPLLLNETLYGTASGGGEAGEGTLFYLDVSSNAFTLLTSFNGSNAGMPAQSVVAAQNGRLYGLSSQGGSLGAGTAYCIALNGTGLNLLASLGGWNGSTPLTQPVLSSDGVTLYCTAGQSGLSGFGTIFSINTITGELTVLHQFQGGPDGAMPYAPLLMAADGTTLYGTTFAGGNDHGTVYRLNTDGSGYEVIHAFSGYDGAGPRSGGLCLDPHGMLLGTTSQGGINGRGAVFSLFPDGSNYTMLHSFTGIDGSVPLSSLVYSSSTHLFYGTASQGGKNGQGTLFQMDENGTGFQVLFDFIGVLGAMPSGGMALDQTNGILYGTALSGGASGLGVLFSYTIAAKH